MTVIPAGRVGDRFVAIFVTASLILSLATTGLFIYLVIRVSGVQGRQQSDNIVSCQQSNVSRTEDVTLFSELLALPPNATAAQKATVARDMTLVRKSYALRDCAAEYG